MPSLGSAGGGLKLMGNKGDGFGLSSRNVFPIIVHGNGSVIAALMRGCFERDPGSFCASRVTEHSCVTWHSSAAAFAPKESLSPKYSTESVLPCLQFTPFPAVVAQAVIWPILLIAGVWLNLWIYNTLKCIRDRNPPILYYTMLCLVLDCVILFQRVSSPWMFLLSNVHISVMLMMTNTVICQTYNLVFSVIIHFRHIIQVALAIDAYQFIVCPLKFTKHYSAFRVKNMVIFVLTICLFINSQFLWTFEVVEKKAPEAQSRYICDVKSKWVLPLYGEVVWPIIDLLVGDVLPAVVVACVVAATMLHVRRQGRRAVFLRHIVPLRRVLISVKEFNQVRYAALYHSALFSLLCLPERVFASAKCVDSIVQSVRHAAEVSSLHEGHAALVLRQRQAHAPTLEYIEMVTKILSLSGHSAVNAVWITQIIAIRRQFCAFIHRPFMTTNCIRHRK